MPPVNLIGPDGSAVSVDEAQVGAYLDLGYAPETLEQETGRVVESELERAYGDSPIAAGTLGVARGLSLGLSDVALRAAGVSAEKLSETQRRNVGASVTGEVIGALAPALLSGGTTAGATGANILRATPAGLVARGERAITAAGAAGTTAERIGAAALGGTVEGAAQGVGAAISDVAMENKPLAAETFVASGAKGALFGAGIGGGIAGAERGMAAVRRLFPKSEVTREAAEVAEQEFKQATAKASATDDALKRTARDELERIRLEAAARNLDVKRQLDEAKIRVAQARAVQQEGIARVKVESAEELARIRAEKAKAGPTPRSKKTAEPAPPAAVSEDAAEVAGRDLDDVTAQVDDRAREIVSAERELDNSKARVNEWLAKYQRKPKPGEVTTRYVETQTGAPIGGGAAPRATDRIVTPGVGPDFSQAIDLSTRSISRAEKAALTAAKAEGEAMEPAIRAAQRSGMLRGFTPGVPLDEGRAAAYRRLLDEAAAGASPAAAQRGYADDIEAMLARAEARTAKQADAMMDDLSEGMEAIGDYERAQARLTDALGDAAPIEAREAAQAMAAKVDDQAAKVTETVAQQADDASARAAQTVALGAPPAVPASGAAKTAGRVADALAAVEVLQMAGVPIPSAERLPVIGPIVSALLKARAFMAVAGRLGGKVPVTAETRMAERVAQVRDRTAKAIDRALEIGEKAARKAAPALVAGGVAALESPLWEDAPRRRVAKPKPESKPVELYRKRIDELTYVAGNPDAVEQAIRARVPVSDPELRKAVTEAALRKLKFLLDKAPQDSRPPSLLKRTEWEPSPAALAQWSRYIRAADDPVSVIDDLAEGNVSPEAAETLRTVYPTMYADVQRQLMEKLPTLEAEMPYSRRVQLGLLFDAPLDDSMSPESQAFLQAAVKSGPEQAQPQGAQPGQPPAPSLASNVSISQSFQTGADRRASRY